VQRAHAGDDVRVEGRGQQRLQRGPRVLGGSSGGAVDEQLCNAGGGLLAAKFSDTDGKTFVTRHHEQHVSA
jgi:hypothetical protein